MSNNSQTGPNKRAGSPKAQTTVKKTKAGSTKNYNLEATWKGDSVIKTHSNDRIVNEGWMTIYLGFRNKFHLRRLTFSALVLPCALEQTQWHFTHTEIIKAIQRLSRQSHGEPEASDKIIEPFSGSLDAVSETYLTGNRKREEVESSDRVSVLARLVLTVSKDIDECLSPADNVTDMAKWDERRQWAQNTLRSLRDEPADSKYYFIPELDFNTLKSPALGPFEFGGKQEGIKERWMRVFCLMRHAVSRTNKTKFETGLASMMPKTREEFDELNAEDVARRQKTSSDKFLGFSYDDEGKMFDDALKSDSPHIFTLQDGPVWMCPENEPRKLRDRNKSTKGKGKASDSGHALGDEMIFRRPLKIEGVWLTAFSKHLCEESMKMWQDKETRQKHGISDHLQSPAFSQLEGKPLPLPDPREFPNFHTWRDALRVELGLPQWGLEFDQVYYFVERVKQQVLDENTLANSWVRLEPGENHTARGIGIFQQDAPCTWEAFLETVEKGEDAQTVAFVVKQCEVDSMDSYDWESPELLNWPGGSVHDLLAFLKGNTVAAEEPMPSPSLHQENGNLFDDAKFSDAAVNQVFKANPITPTAIKAAEAIGRRLAQNTSTSDQNLDVFDMGFAKEYFLNLDVQTDEGRKTWASTLITKVLATLALGNRREVWDNKDWVRLVPDRSARPAAAEQLQYAKDIAESARAEDAAAMEDGDPDELKLTISQAATAVSVSSQACLGPPLETCCKALLFTETATKHGSTNLSTYSSIYFKTESGRGFLPHQVTGVVFMISRLLGKLLELDIDMTARQKIACKYLDNTNAETRCCILADNMGLGKTFQSLSVIYFSMFHGPHSADGQDDYLPTLIIAPSTEILLLWVEEIAAHYPAISVIVAANLPRDRFTRLEGKLDISLVGRKGCVEQWPKKLSYVWSHTDRRAERTIIISTIDTYASRTVRKIRGENNQITHRSRWTDMDRSFRTMWIDEAHRLRNTDTVAYHAIKETKYEGVVLVTATPSFMEHKNIVSLYNIMWRAYSSHMQKNHPKKFDWCTQHVTSIELLHNVLDLPYRDHRKGYSIKPEFVQELVKKQDLPLLNKFMPSIEALVMIRRSALSVIPKTFNGGNISLRGLLPEVNASTINVVQDIFGETISQCVHYSLCMQYTEILRAAQDSSFRPNLAQNTRSFQLISAGINPFRIDRVFANATMSEPTSSNSWTQDKDAKMNTLPPMMTKMRRAGINAFDLVPLLRQVGDPEWESTADSHADALFIHVRGCPTLQVILSEIYRDILLKDPGEENKILIIEDVPLTAFYYERVLQMMGIQCRAYHSGLSVDERESLKESFRSTKPGTVTVLILMYSAGVVGLNLDGACFKVILATPIESHQKEEQCAYRAIRITTKHSKVGVLRIMVKNTYHAYTRSRQIDRLIPRLASRSLDKDVLLTMLNALQVEIDFAHRSFAGKELLNSKNLLAGPFTRTEALDRLLNIAPKLSDELLERLVPEDLREERDLAMMEERSAYELVAKESKGWKDNFLEPTTRKEFSDEWRKLTPAARTFFSYKKNGIRRLLTFPPNKTYTLADLEAAAGTASPLLERALECLIKIKIGARETEHKSCPHIEFDMLPQSAQCAAYKDVPSVDEVEDLDEVEHEKDEN